VTLADPTTSRVTVGPSGRFVYLTAKKEGLVAINAQTGESFTTPLLNQAALAKADFPSLHAPVVILHPDGSEKVYVAANSVNEGVLACFNNRSGAIAAAENWPPLRACGANRYLISYRLAVCNNLPPASRSTRCESQISGAH
jgi:hypothetical protein